MKVLHGFTDVDLQGVGSVVSIGNFDGVHIGHQAVIGSAVQSGLEKGLMSVVCTFDPHTRVFLQPDAPPPPPPLPIEERSFIKVVRATFQPSPSAPNMRSGGIRTSVPVAAAAQSIQRHAMPMAMPLYA